MFVTIESRCVSDVVDQGFGGLVLVLGLILVFIGLKMCLMGLQGIWSSMVVLVLEERYLKCQRA